MTDPTPSLPPMPPSSWRYRLAVTAALVVAAAALYAGVRATETGDDAVVNSRPDVVEQIIPPRGAEALQQAEIGIDLAPGYEGGLILNGTAIPTDELRLVPEQNQVFFAPAQGRSFEALPSGQNCVTAVVWKSADGPGTSSDLTFQWCFDVT
ncbi:MAG: hypothetical protein ACRDZU_11435 [Acidimicrobiales bacterium]